MLYTAKLAKKKKPFQRAYTVENDTVYITDTKRAKRRFLKSGIENVVFGEEFCNDEIIGERIEEISAYSRSLAAGYAEGMLVSLAGFLKIPLPCEEIGVFSDIDIARMATKYAKMVSLVGEGEDEIYNGVQIRSLRKLKAPPTLIIRETGSFSPVFMVPEVNFGNDGIKNPVSLSIDIISFKTDLLPYEVGMRQVMYFVEKGVPIEYEVVSFRKKTPRLFTFG